MKQAAVALTLATLVVAPHARPQVPEDGLTSAELGVRLEPPASRAALVARGEAVYTYWCNACHGPEMIKPGTGALAVKYGGSVPAALAERTDLSAALVEVIVRQGISMMPFFRPTEISNADLQALAAYLTRNSGAE
jgi:(+)-pinoresinol hydroxylase